MSNKISIYDATVKLLEDITQNYYSPNNERIPIKLTDSNHFDFDKKEIHLSLELLEEFHKLRLPRFSVFYHELAHYLYSGACSQLLDKWTSNRLNNTIMYNQKYFHLVNWLEDYYAEWRILKEYPYLSDVLQCIKKIKVEYDINAIEYAFNYYYVTGKASPALTPTDGATFVKYIQDLTNVRNQRLFGVGILSVLTQQNNPNMFYIKGIIDFYNWCVSKGIFPKDVPLPPLKAPNYAVHKTITVPAGVPKEDIEQYLTEQNSATKNGAYTIYTSEVGAFEVNYTVKPPISTPIDVFKNIVEDEDKRINTEYIDMIMKAQADQTTLTGLFNARLEDTSIIQSKIIVKNFFNPNRLQDQVLFQKPTHTYKHVNIYRDISGSTSGSVHTLINDVCKHLQTNIPVEINWYLYSSGDISILQVPFIDWPKSYRPPQEYVSDPIFKKFTGGTNSGAIANVITEQLSDNWLNIIVTDGDLRDLMDRDNINALLKNVFAIVVDSTETLQYPEVKHMYIRDANDIPFINNALMEALC